MKNVTGQDLHKLLKNLDITQKEWGEMMGRDARQVRRWCSGENPIPRPVAILVVWLQRMPYDAAMLKDIINEQHDRLSNHRKEQ